MLKILKYIIGSILILSSVNTNAQIAKNDTSVNITTKVIKDIRFEIDGLSLLNSLVSNKEEYSFEGGVQACLLEKYYPIAEIGFAGAKKTSVQNIDFNTNGLFGRFGVDFRLIKPKPNSKVINNLALGGLRFGFTHFNYDVSNILIEDEYWTESKIYNLENQKATKFWYEIVVGMRVEVAKRIYMGWSVRNKRRLGEPKSGEINPYYIPGYGVNNSSNWNINYMISFQL